VGPVRTLPAALVLVITLSACTPDAPTPSPRAGRAGPGTRGTDVKKTPPAEKAAGPEANPQPPPQPASLWAKKLDQITKGLPVSLQFSYDGTPLYSKGERNKRVPASVEKLPLTMALFETFGPDMRIRTTIAARRRTGRVVRGNVWVVGGGDPTVSDKDAYASALPLRATRVRALAAALERAGIDAITGSVVGSTRPFARDWRAPGWKSYYTGSEVALPSALTLDGNVHKGHYTRHPERLLAEQLTKHLRKSGVEVGGEPLAGAPPRRLNSIASVRSEPLSSLARYMNRESSNFFAEVLGKRLGLETYGAPGTIAKAARAIAAYARARNVAMEAHDCSGLSYENKVSARGLVRLIEQAETEPWGPVLRRGLAKGGTGTLEDRFHEMRVRAKTGTLMGISSLAGWVWLRKVDGWASFAIMSRGLDKSHAIALENRIVKIVYRRARPREPL
jgi:serine-type D-Ala-D-Ala carboxypeptidase/endopeptidase (penicillin-binding protein 4)